MFKCGRGRRSLLIPTAEVPVTNYYRGEILEGDQLPIYMVAFSACFRPRLALPVENRGLVRNASVQQGRTSQVRQAGIFL